MWSRCLSCTFRCLDFGPFIFTTGIIPAWSLSICLIFAAIRSTGTVSLFTASGCGFSSAGLKQVGRIGLGIAGNGFIRRICGTTLRFGPPLLGLVDSVSPDPLFVGCNLIFMVFALARPLPLRKISVFITGMSFLLFIPARYR